MLGGWEPIRRSRSRFSLLALTWAVPALALIVFLAVQFFHRNASPGAHKSTSANEPAPAVQTPADKRIVLIVDDIGYQETQLTQLTSLGARLNFAVLPGTPMARQTAEMLGSRGFEVLCHLPMEPAGHPAVAAGEGVILTSMNNAEIRAQTRRQLRSVPYARGVNNHMGSRATRDRRVMRQVMTVLKQEGAYFVDSMTTPGSVGAEVARATGVRAASRNIFLDHDATERAIRRQIAALAAISEKNGLAIGIAHPHPSTVNVLREEVPRLRARGFRFVAVSEAVN